MRVGVFTGDWEETRMRLREIRRKKVATAVNKELRNLGRATVKLIKEHIDKQDLDWIPLSSSTINTKGHDSVYLETGTFRNSIKYRIQSPSVQAAILDIKPEGDHPSGLPIEVLSRYLEYGTSRIPARPLWRPSFEEMKRLPEFDELLEALSNLGMGAEVNIG